MRRLELSNFKPSEDNGITYMIQIIPFHFSSEQLEFTVDLKGGKNEGFPEFNEKIQVLKDNVAGRYIGGFQLLDLIITKLKSHMTCYNSMPLIG